MVNINISRKEEIPGMAEIDKTPKPKEIVGAGSYRYSCRVELYGRQSQSLASVEIINGVADSLEEGNYSG